jgi:23S rRNA U2552 (ribose-2'-O)-methylase RlmE/FtsJ
MLCTPISLPKATVQIRETPLYTENANIGEVDPVLEKLKEKVGVFKIKHGEIAWKERAAFADRTARLTDTISSPVSRAYFKLVEIIRTCAIRANERSLHLCEAPGGFVQATIGETKCTDIIATSRKFGGAPHFSTTILHADRVNLLKGLPCGSDIMYKECRDEIVACAQSSTLITADGAIDNDTQPEIAEAMTATLIFHEIDTAVRCQKKGGTLVVKIFGLALDLTKECIAVLTTCYENVSIVKPFTSRAVNDERYIVCQNFLSPPTLPMIPDNPHAFIESVARVDHDWMQNLQKIIHDMRMAQRTAIHTALTCTLRDDSASTRPFRPRSRERMKGRGKPYRHRDRGLPQTQESTPGNTTK